MPDSLDLVAIGAHPDDVEMTSGGWLCVAAEQGYRTGVIHLTKGEMGTRGTAAQRVREARAAAKVMGCSVLEFAGLKDGFIRADDASTHRLVELLRKLKPRVVIAPYLQCHHPDHEAAAALAVRAVHLAGLKGYKSRISPHRVIRLVHGRYSRHFEPAFYVDVSRVIERKLRSIECPSSQFTPVSGQPETRMAAQGFLDQYMSLTAQLGLKAGCAHAEAYWLSSAPALNDPVAVLSAGVQHHMIR